MALLKCIDASVLACISPPKMHRRFRIGPPKCIDGFVLAHLRFSSILPQEFYSQWILLTIAIMKEKQHYNLFEIKIKSHPLLEYVNKMQAQSEHRLRISAGHQIGQVCLTIIRLKKIASSKIFQNVSVHNISCSIPQIQWRNLTVA